MEKERNTEDRMDYTECGGEQEAAQASGQENEWRLGGIGVVEIILILVILVGLVVIFKDEVTDIVEKAFKTITNGSRHIIG